MRRTDPNWDVVKENGAKLGDGESGADATDAWEYCTSIAPTDARDHNYRCVVKERNYCEKGHEVQLNCRVRPPESVESVVVQCVRDMDWRHSRKLSSSSVVVFLKIFLFKNITNCSQNYVVNKYAKYKKFNNNNLKNYRDNNFKFLSTKLSTSYIIL